MRKIFWQNMVTLDGYMEGPNGEVDWHVIDDDFDRYGSAMLASLDAMVLGRVTYELFSSVWPTLDNPDAPIINALPKLVFSRTSQSVDWNNSRLVDEAELTRWREGEGKDIAVFGSGTLGTHLFERGLIDEVRLLMAPLRLGAGRPMFREDGVRRSLELVETEAWSSGVVYLRYAVR